MPIAGASRPADIEPWVTAGKSASHPVPAGVSLVDLRPEPRLVGVGDRRIFDRLRSTPPLVVLLAQTSPDAPNRWGGWSIATFSGTRSI